MGNHLKVFKIYMKLWKWRLLIDCKKGNPEKTSHSIFWISVFFCKWVSSKAANEEAGTSVTFLSPSSCPSPSSFLPQTVLHPWRGRLLNGWDPCEVWCFVFWSWAVLFYFAFCRNSTIQMLDRMSCVKLPECCFPVFPEYWGAAVSNIDKGCPLGSWLSKLCQLAGNREEQ